MCLPSGICLREAKVDVLEIGPLHNILEKRWSEPCWVENFPMILNENSAEVKRIAPWGNVLDLVSVKGKGYLKKVSP